MQAAAGSGHAAAQHELFGDAPDVLTVAQAAELLQVDGKSIRREIARGRLGAFRVGKCVRISKQQLIVYIEGRQ